MAEAMALCVLLAVGMAADDAVVRDAATAMAQKIDGRLLAPMAGVSACTGIFILSPALTKSLTSGPTLGLVVGTGLMASAIAFQGWVSIRKPWGRVRAGLRSTGPRWIFAATVLGGLAELSVSLVLGHPLPLLSVTLIVLVLASRHRWSGTRRARPSPA